MKALPNAPLLFLFGTIAVLAAGYVLLGADYFTQLSNVGENEVASSINKNELEDRKALVQLGTIRDARLNEISGIANSLNGTGRYWVHNDSGNPAELFLINASGTVLARVKLKGARNIDWEDICSFQLSGINYVCVGDVGDNLGRRSKYQLYLFKEPKVDEAEPNHSSEIPTHTVSNASVIEFRYEDGAKNCEGFAFDRDRLAFLFVEKGFHNGKPGANEVPGIYELAVEFADNGNLQPKGQATAKRIADSKIRQATAMDISDDSKTLVISSYSSSILVMRDTNVTWPNRLNQCKPQQMPIPLQRQGEAICLSKAGEFAIVTSEFTSQPIWQINIEETLNAIKQRKQDD